MTAPQPDYRPANAGDLYAWGERDPTVKAVLVMWECGDFPSIEKAMLHLCCILAFEKSKLQKALCDRLEREARRAEEATNQEAQAGVPARHGAAVGQGD